MFKNIDVLHGAGVLDGYKGAATGLPDFGRYNLIYGWNASGKTSLSRFFQLMERPDRSRIPPGAYARFRTEHGDLDTRNEQDRAQCSVRVFNSDFVEDNLQRGHTAASALFIIGDENIRLDQRIALLTHQRQRMASIYREVSNRNDGAVKVREGQATSLAAECGGILGVRAFRAPDLKRLAARIGADAAMHLLDADALQSEITAARDQSSYELLRSPLYPLPSRLPEADDFASLLSNTPHQQTIVRLQQNRELSDWVRTGLHIHQGKSRCEFCGGDAAQALAEYAQHFSDEYQRQFSAIQAAIRGLEGFTATAQLPHQNAWTPPLRSRAEEAEGRLAQWLQQEKLRREFWRAQLIEKLEHMETPIQVISEGERLSGLAAIVQDLDALVAEHNRACNEVVELRRKAADCIKNHFAARYLQDTESVEAEKAVAAANAVLVRAGEIGEAVSRLLRSRVSHCL